MTSNGGSSNGAPPEAGLRLLIINWQDRLHPRAGGAEVHLHEVFGRLVSRGHPVTLVSCGWRGAPAREQVDGIRVHRVGTRATFGWDGVRYCRRLLERESFDLVVDDFNKAPHFSPWWTRLPVLLLVHHLFGRTAFQASSPLVAAASLLLEQTLPRVYRNTSVQVVSRSSADDLVRRGFRPELVRVVHNGVDLGFFGAAPNVTRATEPTVLYLGRLQRYKRVDLAVRAVAALAAEGVAVHLVVAGTGVQQAALRRLAEDCGIAHRVEFTGYVSEEGKRELMQRAWVHVLNSPKEGWGLTVIEAAACRTPTVASNSPGVRDAIVPGETGLLVPHGDVAALADALRLLVTNRALVEQLGAAARRFAERFPWDRAAAETEANVRDVVKHGGFPRPAQSGLPRSG